MKCLTIGETYPFVLTITVDNDGEMIAEVGTCSITIALNWDFELDDRSI